MELIPLNKRVIVKVTKAAEKSAGGIIIPDSGKEKPTMGTIISYDASTEQPIAVGMIILFGKYAGSEFNVAGEDYLILKEEEIIAVVAV